MYKIINSFIFLSISFSAFVHADFDIGLTVLNNHDLITALTEWRPLSDEAHVKAQYARSLIFASAHKVPQNDAQAIIFYRKNADQGDAQAQFNLSLMYATGQGVPRNDAQALIWCHKAADQGHAGAQFKLGHLYDEGPGVPQGSRPGICSSAI